MKSFAQGHTAGICSGPVWSPNHHVKCHSSHLEFQLFNSGSHWLCGSDPELKLRVEVEGEVGPHVTFLMADGRIATVD